MSIKDFLTRAAAALSDLGSEDRLFFWSPSKRPQDFQSTPRWKVTPARRAELVKLLMHGNVLMSYMGHADCRICGAELGFRDLGDFGLVWPEKAEHYVLEHGVWLPDCDKLLAAAAMGRR